MTSNCSANRSNRSPMGGKGMPKASCSRWYHPVPRPSSARPPLISSTLATIVASRPGRRNVAGVTREPSRIRTVSRASPASVVQQSVGRYVGSVGSTPNRWSERKNASKPARSVAFARARIWAYVLPCRGSRRIRNLAGNSVGATSVLVHEDAADVLSVEHVLVALVDLLQPVPARDQLIQLEVARAVQAEQPRHVVQRIAAAEDGALHP